MCHLNFNRRKKTEPSHEAQCEEGATDTGNQWRRQESPDGSLEWMRSLKDSDFYSSAVLPARVAARTSASSPLARPHSWHP